ncbi:MAG TPA: hypothetical protein VNX25_00940 [Verrucomicrobiae bacterium]|nr:hypothetical protein [Verrucomicrobiae bacterium]
MTHLETARVNEALELEIAAIRDHAARLAQAAVADFENEVEELATAVSRLQSMIEALPHHHRRQ